MANPMIAVLKRYGSPVNRHEYLATAYMGKPPANPDPESEGELPQDDVRFMVGRPTTHEDKVGEEAAKAGVPESEIGMDGKAPDITIGGGAKGTEQKFTQGQKYLDQLDDQQYGGKRKSNLI